MPFSATFHDFYSKVEDSLSEGTFAKLTLAKTIGNTELMNIYVRAVIDEHVLKLELKFKFQKEEIIEIYTVHKAFNRLLAFINNPFLSAILFTTEFDLIYKLNKKRAISITDQSPTFAHASPVVLEYLAGI